MAFAKLIILNELIPSMLLGCKLETKVEDSAAGNNLHASVFRENAP